MLSSFRSGKSEDVINPEQLEFLQSFYDNLGGTDWNWLPETYGAEWTFTESSAANPCAPPLWQGITCGECEPYYGEEICSVISIELPGYNLVGSLENVAYFSYMDMLRILNLNNNSLTGYLNYDMNYMYYLENMTMDNNQILGFYPGTTYEYTKLRTLSMSNNAMVGSIPSFISASTALLTLDLSKNSLTGGISNAIGAVDSFVTFNLADNMLTGKIFLVSNNALVLLLHIHLMSLTTRELLLL